MTRSVRARTTVAACAVLVVSLTVSAVGLLWLLHHRLISNIDTALELRGDDVVLAIESGSRIEDLPVISDEDNFVQVIDSAGRVVSASASVRRASPIAPSSRIGPRTVRVPTLANASYRVFVAVTNGEPTYSVVTGTSLVDANGTTRSLAGALALGVPLLVALVTTATWVLVGRALRPVESIRAEVADIKDSTDLNRRVPEPATGDEVSRLARTMNEMLDRLQAAQDRQKQFMSDASHELRTPITTMRHQLDIAVNHPDRVDSNRLSGELLVETERMSRLVDDLLWLAHRDEGRSRPPATPVDLDDLVLTEAARLRSNGRAVDTSAVSAGQVRGDPYELVRAIRNLVDNADRHATSGLAFGVQTSGGTVTVTIDDDGPGIAEADRERIFERFTRLDESRTGDRGGAGLGLAIVAQIVSNHGGSIDVGTAPLGGARVALAFPDSRADSDD
jgi:signal transduction histidine kinase